ncbi:Occludin [Oryzias melastigma]|uniref:Occludin n=1 Tax=Oryzias melastigma TaxID=30732 RepID=A0A834EYU2_ORYME|nr:Occludin [Oryzias melastigma]
MSSSRHKESPPPYDEGGAFIAPSQPAYSYYADEEIQHFYRWTSPPGIIKIMAIIVILLCVAIFACVASSLAHDSAGALSSFGGYAPGYGGGGYGGSSYGGGGYGGSSYGGAYGGGYGGSSYGGMYTDPRQGKGFFIALAVIVFIFALVVFIIIVSHQSLSESRKFYLATVIICAILALLMLIATIVYLMAVNPSAQSSGSVYGNQIAMLCAPYTQQQMQGPMVNQYLYYYCVVEPHEAVAVVFGFLATAALIIMLVFAVKTRQKIISYGKNNIFWKRVKNVEEEAPQDVAAWVNETAAPRSEDGLSSYPEKRRGSTNYLDEENIYDRPPSAETPQPVLEHQALQNAAPYNSSSEIASSYGMPKKPRPGRPRRINGQDYDTDYNSSGDELDDDDFDGEFPPIRNEQERNSYKREFDKDHNEYKSLQAELDNINRKLSELDGELDELEEGSPQYLDTLEEYNFIRDSKKNPDYRMKKRRCKHLKAKLNHIKKMVSDYDRRA